MISACWSKAREDEVLLKSGASIEKVVRCSTDSES